MKLKSLAALVLISVSVSAFAQQGNPDQVYNDLNNSSYWTHPDFNGKLDLNQIRSTADQVKPYTFKLLAVPKLGTKWVKNGKEQRESFARYVSEQKLHLGDKGIMVVLTKSGIWAYNKRLSESQMMQINSTAKGLVKPNDFTPAVIGAATGIKTQLDTQGSTTTPSTTPVGLNPSSNADNGGGKIFGYLCCIGVPLALIGMIFAIVQIGKKNAIARSRRAAEDRKKQAIDALSYIDSYDGLLLNGGQEADALKQYRDRMGENFDTALSRFNSSKTVADYDQANYAFQQVLQDFDSAKGHVNALTGGSGVAYTIPPIVDNERAPLFEPVKGVSYFSSQPSDQLVPVEVNFGGARKTVMVTPQERDELMAGRMPQLRGQYMQNGNFQPWYSVPGYDPYRDYGSNNFIWQMIGISALSNMFMPHYGYGWGGGLFGGGGYGNYGHDTVINNYYGSDSNYYDHSSAGDFGSGSSSDNSSSGDFDFGSSSDNSSSGDFDFGGGGDSGGGDFGGGGDSGGGDF